MSENPRQEIQRVYLAPHKQNGDWTVDDLMQFVTDCVKSGISGNTKLVRDYDQFSFDNGIHRGFYAERRTELPSTQGQSE